MKASYSPGDQLTASDFNEVVSLTRENAHNILELYMENYFASKSTPYQGLFFDGFSDTTRKHVGAGTTSGSTAAGQKNIVLASSGQAATFAVGDTIQIYDATNQETATIASISSATLTVQANLAYTYANGTAVTACSVTFTTASKRLDMTAGIGDLKKAIYQSIDTVFSQDMKSCNLWLTRKPTKVNLAASVALNTTSLTLKGFVAPANNDLIDIVTTATKKRERKTVSSTSIGSTTAVVADSAGAGMSTSGTTITVAHTIGAGSNRILIVCCAPVNGVVSGITFNGAAMTAVAGSISGTSTAYVYYMMNPPTGTFNIVATYTGAGYAYLDRASFANVDQTVVPTFTAGSYVSGGTAASATVQSNSTGHMVLALLNSGSGATGTAVATGYSAISGQVPTVLAYKQAAVGANTASWTWSGGVNAQAAQILLQCVAPTITVNFTPAVTTTAGFTTSDTVERVDVLPYISMVDQTANKAYASPTFIQSMEVTVDGVVSVEDQYQYTPATPENKVAVRLDVSRVDVSLAPLVQRLGLVFNT